MTVLNSPSSGAVAAGLLDTNRVAEYIRAAAGLVYADACQAVPDDFSCHQNRIISVVSARLGLGLACGVDREYLAGLFDILVRIGDLAHVGDGHYVPRESRVTMFAEGWGRIAGGVPLECSGISGKSIEDHLDGVSTIGRMVKLAAGYIPIDWEEAGIYLWSRASNEELYRHLLKNAVGAKCAPLTESCEFYDIGRRGRTRGERWHPRPVDSTSFVIARKPGSQPAYFLILDDAKSRARDWFELEKDDARQWVLLAERMAQVKNSLRAVEIDGGRLVYVPDMLPEFSLVALFSCASAVVRTEKGWEMEVLTSLDDFLARMLAYNNCVIS